MVENKIQTPNPEDLKLPKNNWPVLYEDSSSIFTKLKNILLKRQSFKSTDENPFGIPQSKLPSSPYVPDIGSHGQYIRPPEEESVTTNKKMMGHALPENLIGSMQNHKKGWSVKFPDTTTRKNSFLQIVLSSMVDFHKPIIKAVIAMFIASVVFAIFGAVQIAQILLMLFFLILFILPLTIIYSLVRGIKEANKF